MAEFHADDGTMPGSVVLDHVVEPIRRMIRISAESEEAATRRSLDVVGLFDARVVQVVEDVRGALEREKEAL
ncbi:MULTISPECIES: hypothetical protein [unclassified Xanthobacter]|uniref:hypothetical protein n=1 Tax=unclassified Xanthobacter TaxID=2623496 RepID=UPI001F2C0DDA|nr:MULTISPECIES: hypothetical protein [unclassified Xanthobacter]